MNYKDILLKKLSELPDQINLIKKELSKIQDQTTLQEKMVDLQEYEDRMRKGIEFLNNIEDQDIIKDIENIRNHPAELTTRNKERYLSALIEYRKKNNIHITDDQLEAIESEIRKIKLVHTTSNPELIKENGIKPASALWMTPYKSCANAMDIALGLDKCTFFTHGFSLDNFSQHYVSVDQSRIDDPTTIVTSLDLFTFVLIKTKKVAPCSIHTEEWIEALDDYSKNLFHGKDFWHLKAQYILTFFDSIEEFESFAKKNFYNNTIQKAPPHEYPFLGEIKIFSQINPTEIL